MSECVFFLISNVVIWNSLKASGAAAAVNKISAWIKRSLRFSGCWMQIKHTQWTLLVPAFSPQLTRQRGTYAESRDSRHVRGRPVFQRHWHTSLARALMQRQGENIHARLREFADKSPQRGLVPAWIYGIYHRRALALFPYVHEKKKNKNIWYNQK